MIHECTYCDYNTTTKCNIRRHVRNKHREVLTTKKNIVKCEKTDDTQHQLKK